VLFGTRSNAGGRITERVEVTDNAPVLDWAQVRFCSKSFKRNVNKIW